LRTMVSDSGIWQEKIQKDGNKKSYHALRKYFYNELSVPIFCLFRLFYA
jgi:hypothetical protein